MEIFTGFLQNVTASLDSKGNVVGYYSVRRKPKDGSIKIVEDLYTSLLRAEKSAGVSASEKLLNEVLQEKGVSYDELIISLQK